jgi:hypothetical protein
MPIFLFLLERKALFGKNFLRFGVQQTAKFDVKPHFQKSRLIPQRKMQEYRLLAYIYTFNAKLIPFKLI